MTILLLQPKDKFWRGVTPYSYCVGVLPKEENLRSQLLLELETDATVLDATKLKPVTVSRIFHKFSNGMGSTDDPTGFVEAFILAGAKEVK